MYALKRPLSSVDSHQPTRDKVGDMQLMEMGAKVCDAIEAHVAEGSPFANAAEIALNEARLHDSLTLESCLHELAQTPEFPTQLNPYSNFGQPPVTFYRRKGIICDLYFWVHQDTSLHSHTFHGAFQVIEGKSLQATYDFLSRKKFTETIEVGDVSCRHLELLSKGDVRQVRAGDEFFHLVAHLACPALTLVIRDESNAPASRLWGNNLRLSYASLLPPTFHRKTELLKFARKTSACDLGVLMRSLLASGSEHEAINWFLKTAVNLEPEDRDALIAASGLAQRAWLDDALTTLNYIDQVGYGSAMVDNEDIRLVNALGQSQTNRNGSFRILSEFWGTNDVGQRLVETLEVLSEKTTMSFELNESARELVSRLVDGWSTEKITEHFVANHPAEEQQVRGDIVHAVKQLKSQAFLACFIA